MRARLRARASRARRREAWARRRSRAAADPVPRGAGMRSASAHYTLRENALDARAATLRVTAPALRDPAPAADNPRTMLFSRFARAARPLGVPGRGSRMRWIALALLVAVPAMATNDPFPRIWSYAGNTTQGAPLIRPPDLYQPMDLTAVRNRARFGINT